MNKFIILIFLLLTFVFSCKKKDKVGTISGRVINKTTQKPVNGLAVILKSSTDSRGGFPFGKTLWGKYSETLTKSFTDADGNFNFENAEISSKADYELFTSSYVSLYNGRSDFGDAKTIGVDKGNLGKFYQLEVTPLMDYLWIQLNPSTPIIFPDSVSINLTHKYLYNNQATGNITTYRLKDGYKAYALQQAVMGQWYINIYKYKGGNIYNMQDSVFLNYGDTLTYKLNF